VRRADVLGCDVLTCGEAATITISIPWCQRGRRGRRVLRRV